MAKPTPGEIIWVLCDPEQNNGRDVMPATITGVNDDGTCNAIGHPDVAGQTSVDLRNVIVASSRSTAEKELESHVKDMPKVRDPETDRPRRWQPADVLPWVKVGYPPAGSSPTSTPDSPPAKKQAAAARRAPVKKTTTAKATAPAAV